MIKSLKQQGLNMNQIDQKLFYLKDLLEQEKLPVQKLSHNKWIFLWFICHLKQ